MRRFSRAAIVLSFLLVCASAVSAAPQAQKVASIADPSHPSQGSSSGASLDVSKAQAVQVELTKNIRATKAKTGDLVKARTVTAIILPGQVVIPEGTKLIGHVTQATSGAAGGNTAIAIAFDHFELKNRQVLAADFSIRSGAMYARPVHPSEADDETAEAQPASPTPTTPNNPSKPSHMTLGGFTNSTKTQLDHAHSQAQSQQPPLTVQTADNRGDMRAITKGSLIGLPGVALRLDEASGAATFESAKRKLELKMGLQLLLSVEAVKAVAPTLSSSSPK